MSDRNIEDIIGASEYSQYIIKGAGINDKRRFY